MLEELTFSRLLYRVAYTIAAIFFIFGCFTADDSLFGLCFMQLIIGAVFNFKYFIKTLKKGDKNDYNFNY